LKNIPTDPSRLKDLYKNDLDEDLKRELEAYVESFALIF